LTAFTAMHVKSCSLQFKIYQLDCMEEEQNCALPPPV